MQLMLTPYRLDDEHSIFGILMGPAVSNNQAVCMVIIYLELKQEKAGLEMYIDELWLTYKLIKTKIRTRYYKYNIYIST